MFRILQMPVMNGYEATKVLRSSGRAYIRDIPIVAMSANAFVDDVLKSKKAGIL